MVKWPTEDLFMAPATDKILKIYGTCLKSTGHISCNLSYSQKQGFDIKIVILMMTSNNQEILLPVIKTLSMGVKKLACKKIMMLKNWKFLDIL